MKKLLVFTDLDGTLLDHASYQWQAAASAIARLHELHCPLIFSSSKTYTEMQGLAQAMDNHAPLVCENGSSIAIPQGPAPGNDKFVLFGKDYDSIVTVLNELRECGQYRFTGFNDMNVAEVVHLTGLSVEQAALAKQRRSSEPLLWQDSDAALNEFRQALQARGFSLSRGGRFYSVGGQCSKADGVRWLRRYYEELEPDTNWLSVALGDSGNDIEMLAQVEFPVLIKNPHASTPAVEGLSHLMRPTQAGPQGWNTAIHELIGKLL